MGRPLIEFPAPPLYRDDGGTAAPQHRGYVCCAVCGHPAFGAVHLPALGAPLGAPAWDHEFVCPSTRREANQTSEDAA